MVWVGLGGWFVGFGFAVWFALFVRVFVVVWAVDLVVWIVCLLCL